MSVFRSKHLFYDFLKIDGQQQTRLGWLWRSLALTFIPLLSACNNPGYLVLPTQTFGNSLNSLAAEEQPNLSFNGQYVVFASDRLGYRAIFLFDLVQRRLIDLPGLNTPGVLHDQPDISADGRYIVFVSEARGKPDVYTYDRFTRQTQLITRDLLGDIRQPSISGNGRFVVFQSNRTGQWDLVVFDRGPAVVTGLPGAPGASPTTQTGN
jgi:Tol biopolymer transport system component